MKVMLNIRIDQRPTVYEIGYDTDTSIGHLDKIRHAFCLQLEYVLWMLEHDINPSDPSAEAQVDLLRQKGIMPP